MKLRYSDLYSNLRKHTLFSEHVFGHVYKNTQDLNLSSNQTNMRVNKLNQESYQLSEPQKNSSVYKSCPNITVFERIKGTANEYIKKYGSKKVFVKIPSGLSDAEKTLFENRVIRKMFKVFYSTRTVRVLKSLLLKKRSSIYRSLKTGKGWKNSWYHYVNFDIILYLESFGFRRWVKTMTWLSFSELRRTKKNHLSVRWGKKPLNKEIPSSILYWTNFESTLKSKPILWINTLNVWKESYLEMKNWKFFQSLRQLMYYIENNTTHFPLRNVWIESPKGKWRCICVPNFASRWLCRMWNDSLSLWVKPRILPEYHGFIYNKGCLSWWKMFLINNYHKKYDYIYEFDLASFFPNVNKKEALEALKYFNVPERYAIHMIKLVSGEIKESETYPSEQCYYEEYLNRDYRNTNRNLPMGNALCPLISSLVIYKHFDELGLTREFDIKVTGYADDNMILMTKKGFDQLMSKSNNDIAGYLTDYQKGIIVEPQKSGWVKSAGKWEKPLKNLGMLLDNSILYGSTRGTDKTKASSLELKLGSITLESLLAEPEKLNELFGWLQSRLYLGQWDYEIEQDFSLIDDKESFGYKFGNLNNFRTRIKFDLNITNLSSYLNAKVLRYILFKTRNIKDNRITDEAIKWKQNDELYFRKFKELTSDIESLPACLKWENLPSSKKTS